MRNWYEMPGALDGLENNSEFQKKLLIDVEDKREKRPFSTSDKEKHWNHWSKKRAYKKRLIRKFLTINPGFHFHDEEGTNCESAIYNKWESTDCYTINPFTKTYLSKRGDIRKYHGYIEIDSFRFYTVTGKGRKRQCAVNLGNRRLRRMVLDEDATIKFGFLKKHCWKEAYQTEA